MTKCVPSAAGRQSRVAVLRCSEGQQGWIIFTLGLNLRLSLNPRQNKVQGSWAPLPTAKLTIRHRKTDIQAEICLFV